MTALRHAAVAEIEEHLVSLGKGNHEDNMKQVADAPNHYLVELSEHEFRNLVFLQTRTVATIAPTGEDRRLESVAHRALKLSEDQRVLGPNWDIRSIVEKTLFWLGGPDRGVLPALLVRDTKGGEKKLPLCEWYLQDGSHRALGYMMAVVSGQTDYRPQLAYCATTRDLTPSTRSEGIGG